jgi:hypothetical protein
VREREKEGKREREREKEKKIERQMEKRELRSARAHNFYDLV